MGDNDDAELAAEYDRQRGYDRPRSERSAEARVMTDAAIVAAIRREEKRTGRRLLVSE